jgi:nucleotide-binding universal stress UspA family protein
MFKYILVPATGAETDVPVFATALAVARLSAAHVEFLHVRLDVQRTVAAIASADMGVGTGYDQIISSLEQDVAEREKKAEVLFREFCQREGMTISSEASIHQASAEWSTETGEESESLARHGRAADLVVMGRARGGRIVAMDVLEATLMTTGRPVLIASAKAPSRLSGTVVIAWKNTPEAARAMAAAQPFIETSSRVIILSVEENGETDEQSCERLRHALSWHNPNTNVQHLKQDSRPPFEVLLTAAGTAQADLLVMGGYGHSRLREVISGGFTKRVLTAADLPVLMAH